MIVVDASVLTAALTDDGLPGKESRARLARDSYWVAPEHLAVETFHSIRGLLLGGKISEARAEVAIAGLAQADIESVQVRDLLPRMWELRGRVSGYDAAYVATAEAYGCPLITADGRLSRCGGTLCEIEMID